ncbi:MAG TPA: 2-succinyl-5-enolpyruvyl-6-hydroxy-3-cyclohexene-1-carboxylic-acid synthase [Vicinamibacterales bacterium]
MNQALALEVVERLLAAGVRTFCLCPGGRNAPLVEVLEHVPAEVLSFFEERSAAFFALGRARRDETPTAVVTTSGTAAAELLPAMVEASYSGLPLVAVTADRPKIYRGTGAPQTIEQARLFGVYARTFVDLDAPGDNWPIDTCAGPAHVNVCFDEPLLGGWQPSQRAPRPAAAESVPAATETRVARASRPCEASAARVARASRPCEAAAAPVARASRPCEAHVRQVEGFLSTIRAPLVMLGALHRADDRERVHAFATGLQAPVLAEASSHLRHSLGAIALRSGDAAAERGLSAGLFDAVIRVGEIPSWRVWRDLEAKYRLPTLSMSRTEWRGLTHGTHLRIPSDVPLPLPDVCAEPVGRPGTRRIIEWDRRIEQATTALLHTFPDSEPALVRRLSETVAPGSFVYVGNSQPIREWNRFATFDDRGWTIGESRGANGIDGQVSTFLGMARPGGDNWALVGDLTALYDLPSLWALRHLARHRLRLVVMNNGGGRIFDRMFRSERFQNRHAVGFEAWAAMWGLDYACDLSAPALESQAVLIELRPDEDQTREFWVRLTAETRA